MTGSSVSRVKPRTSKKNTTSEKEVVPLASAPLGAADEPKGQNRIPRRRPRGGRRKGFVSPSRKLTDEQAVEIRFLVASGKISERKAGREYGVSSKTIRGIMAGKLYVKRGRPARVESHECSTRERYEPTPPEPWPLPAARLELDYSARSYSLFPPKRRSA
jgi:hypothetical protein